ncbi:unnamed protein product [Microthlaspi erraticum]|uniref:non-specific serine/threonine protein kinase n=1 Tax=Microthlaspi erraticum TaxID=1685480 RepID=A0A6D2IQS2_9BRAS|nr:unnamed protein product [Microthlaspi erraticum]
MSSKIGVVYILLVLLLFKICSVSAFTNISDASALQALKSEWTRYPESWKGSDPCGTSWVGVTCSNDRVISISLANLNLEGKLSADISALSELQILDLTSNSKLSGPLPPNIGNLKKLTTLNLMGCGFSGQIPDSIGSLEQLNTLLFDGNQLTGKIPNSLSLVKNLTVLRLDRNKLIGDIPPSLNNLTDLFELYLASNRFTGSLPNLSNLTNLHTLDVSNNQLTFSLIPSWISSLTSLSTLRMEGIQLEGPIPISLFNPIQLQTVVLKRNQLNATLDFGTSSSNQLEFVDLQTNGITGYNQPANKPIQVILADNPVCKESGNQQSDFCKASQSNNSFSIPQINCSSCSHGKEPTPACRCVYPITGTLTFRSPSFSGFSNNTNFIMLQKELADLFKDPKYQMEAVAIRNIKETSPDHHLLIEVLVFPLGKESFDETGMNRVITEFSTHNFDPPSIFGPYIFKADLYIPFSGGSASSNTGIIIGAAVGAAVLLLLLTIAGIYAIWQKKRAERATGRNNPFAKWNKSKSSLDAPRLMGAKAFTFEELKKCTENFSEANNVGGGGYGQVYKGILPSGQLIAIKRAQQGSSQGELEFKNEIELLSRVHHKNVVRLLGFCFDRNEQMLVYEYIPNGSLTDSLSGKSGIVLDWTRRLRIALGSGKGLAYLHELADPPIIHRDIKSNNILLDESLTAKVADFGLSKLVGDPEKVHVTTQVKGTMGYLDPEYYMTNQLTEKSDVYGFGVVMLELLTGKSPIVGGKYVVREVQRKMDKSRSLYDLQEFLDPAIIASSGNLKGFETYVDLALRCVEGEGLKRPTMGEVVKEIESIMQLVGLNPNIDSATSSRTYEEASKGSGDPYGKQ